MSANIKIGNDTLQGVDAVELENADALGSYVKFTLGGGGGSVPGGYTVTFVANGSNFEVCSIVAGKSVAQARANILMVGTQTQQAAQK